MKINIDYIARVEGESAVKLEIENGRLKDLNLNIWEPPRFFEGFLTGRRFDEVPDIVARICGICPVSHMTTAIRAIENAAGFIPSPNIKRLREIIALSQIISSHLAHLYVLAIPDYFKVNSIVQLLPKFEKEIKRFIKMKEVSNSITALFGGRALHPVSMVVGGFTKVPSRNDIGKVIKKLESLKDDTIETMKLLSGLSYPNLRTDTEYVAITCEDRYAINEGTIASSLGLKSREHEYHLYFEEDELPYSNAKRTVIKGRGSLMVGALSRLNLNFNTLHSEARKATGDIGFRPFEKNPFLNNIAQAVEIIHCVLRCIELLEKFSGEDSLIDVRIKEGSGSAVTEAPRGMLYHHYEIDRRGIIVKANIVTPTAHNFLSLEEGLKKIVNENIDKPKEDIILLCEMLVRAYDPCFSCSVH
jgi:coenzyme F420-reducing hydrogenase alpha subunit